MTKLEIFNKLMELAKENGYTGPDYKDEIGRVLDGTNAYAVFFREDFSKAIWGDSDIKYDIKMGLHRPEKDTPRWQVGITKLATASDKWKFLENNVLTD